MMENFEKKIQSFLHELCKELLCQPRLSKQPESQHSIAETRAKNLKATRFFNWEMPNANNKKLLDG